MTVIWILYAETDERIHIGLTITWISLPLGQIEIVGGMFCVNFLHEDYIIKLSFYLASNIDYFFLLSSDGLVSSSLVFFVHNASTL